MVKNGTADTSAVAALPKAPAGAITFPSVAQTTAAENLVSQDWASAIGG